jgi:hypothetical protein
LEQRIYPFAEKVRNFQYRSARTMF